MKKTIKRLTAEDRSKLSEFVFNHPKGNIFQTPEMYEVYEKSDQFEPVWVTRTDENGNITSSYLGHLYSESKGMKGSLQKRAYAIGEPLSEGIAAKQQILDDLHNEIKKRALYIKVINLSEPKENHHSDIFKNYEFEPHLNFLINLKVGEDELWKNLHDTRRKQIKRGHNRGIRVEVTDTIKNVDLYRDVLKSTYKRVGIDESDLSLLDSSIKILSPKKYIHFISAYFEDKLIAHRIVLTYKGYIYDWFAGNLDEYNHLYPNDVLVWETIKWGAQNNYHTFNFGGAGHPDKPYGVREFKKKFGGQLVNFGYHTKVFKPTTYKFLKVMHRLITKSS